MTLSFDERSRLAVLSWLATVLMAFAFLPALSQKGFILAAALISGLVVLVGIGLRAARTPSLLVLLVQLLVLAELLLIFYGQRLKFGLIPTPTTYDLLQTTISDAMQVAQTYAAPAPPSTGLTLLVVFYIGLIAVLVDFLAVGLHRVALAGLPLLALYSVPVATLPNGVSFLGFLPGAIGFIAMLMVDERDRLAHWGRLVARDLSPDHDGTIDTSGLSATGRRISSLALATAVIVPIFIPVFSTTLFNGSGKGLGNGNGTSLSFSDPMVSLATSLRRKDPVDILRVTGDVLPQYIRLSVLDVPGPNSWAVSRINLGDTQLANSLLPGPTGLEANVNTTSHTMQIEPTSQFPDDSAWLPVPYDVRTINVDNDWSYVTQSQTVTANAQQAAAGVTSYSMAYASVEPTTAQLRAAGPVPADIRRKYAEVPNGVPQIVSNVAHAVTSGITNPYDQAVALQSFFRDNQQFSYDLNAGYGYGYQAMAKFLVQRRGFCQHFSATMAMMARELGIPSRVVVGFLQPQRSDGATWVLTSNDVHAWPELYFDRIGWVRFEPTPGVGAPLPAYAPRVTSSVPTSATVNSATEQTSIDKRTDGSGGTTNGAAAGGRRAGGGAIPSRWWLVVVVLAGLALAPAVARFAIRRRRMTRPVDEGAAAESAWVELRDHILDLRLPWTGSLTPRARRRALEPMLEGDAGGLAALGRLALTVERARYATSVAPDSEPASDAREVMAVISKTAEPGQRIRAVLWPSSLLPDLRAGWEAFRSRLRRPPSLDR